MPQSLTRVVDILSYVICIRVRGFVFFSLSCGYQMCVQGVLRVCAGRLWQPARVLLMSKCLRICALIVRMYSIFAKLSFIVVAHLDEETHSATETACPCPVQPRALGSQCVSFKLGRASGAMAHKSNPYKKAGQLFCGLACSLRKEYCWQCFRLMLRRDRSSGGSGRRSALVDYKRSAERCAKGQSEEADRFV